MTKEIRIEQKKVAKVEKGSVLRTAEQIVGGPRRESYGSANESFGRIARAWSDILGVNVPARKVALCMVSLKVLRDSHRPKRDNLVDIAGYAALADRL